MRPSFFFYDLETSGFSPREVRIMQFAGQRTDLNLKPVGEPVNCLIKMTPDILPDPSAVLVTGITPQQTLEEGVTEAEFLELFYREVVKPGTIFVGYNSVRFDDEFMRYLHWRNYYDPYEWQWKNDCSRWDLLDVVRMTRALRPDGIEWPVDSTQGKPTNRLELLTAANKIDHTSAHDALADVKATIAVAKLIKGKQPKLFDFLLNIRDKKSVEKLVNADELFDFAQGKPFVYTSGKYASEFEKTTVVTKLADTTGGALVYDLRHDPKEFVGLEPSALAERWQFTKDENAPHQLPVKTLKFNHCPAIAPLAVLDTASQERLKLNLETIEKNRKKIMAESDFAKNVLAALKIMDESRDKKWRGQPSEAESQLYDGFLESTDKSRLSVAREASKEPNFIDKRLNEIWPRYVARNYPSKMNQEQAAAWEKYRTEKLLAGGENSRLANYFKIIEQLAASNATKDQMYLLEELKLYGESIAPGID